MRKIKKRQDNKAGGTATGPREDSSCGEKQMVRLAGRGDSETHRGRKGEKSVFFQLSCAQCLLRCRMSGKNREI